MSDAKVDISRAIGQQVPAYSVWLDFIRGVAAAVVFVGHARTLFVGSILGPVGIAATTGELQAGTEPTTNNGHMAVIIFFVLSGYLVGGSVIRAVRANRFSPDQYVIQRLARLWTVLIPILIIGYFLDGFSIHYFGTGSIYGGPVGQGIVPPRVAENVSIQVLLVNAFFLQGIAGPIFGTNGPLWTLAYEFWFYAAFPFLVLSLSRSTSLKIRVLCVFCLAGIGIVVGSTITLYFLIWLFGAAVELLPRKIPKEMVRPVAAVTGVAFIVLCLILLKLRLNIVASDFIEAAAAALLCYVVLHLQHERPVSLFSKFCSGISGVSYTLYLCHAPFLVFVCALVMPVWALWPLGFVGLLKFSAVVGIVFVVAVVLWWCFERNTPHVRRWLSNSYRLISLSILKATS